MKMLLSVLMSSCVLSKVKKKSGGGGEANS